MAPGWLLRTTNHDNIMWWVILFLLSTTGTTLWAPTKGVGKTSSHVADFKAHPADRSPQHWFIWVFEQRDLSVPESWRSTGMLSFTEIYPSRRPCWWLVASPLTAGWPNILCPMHLTRRCHDCLHCGTSRLRPTYSNILKFGVAACVVDVFFFFLVDVAVTKKKTSQAG